MLSASSDLGEHVGHVAAGHRATLELADLDPAGRHVVGEPPGPHDGPVEVARADVVVGGLLGAQVDLEDVVGVRVGALGAHRRDHHVAAYAGGLGRVGQHDRGTLVDGLLARGVAVGPPPAANTHGVGAAHHLGHRLDVGVLEVDHGRLDAVLPRGRGRGRALRTMPTASWPACDDEPAELPGDLTVASCDDDAHLSPDLWSMTVAVGPCHRAPDVGRSARR